VIEMNKNTVAVLVFVFLMMFAMVAPALAAPAEKVTFIAKQIPDNPQPQQGDDFVRVTTNGDIVHCRNQIGSGTIKLWLGTVATGTPNYQGETDSISMWSLNLKSEPAPTGPIKLEMTWTFTNGGIFEGNIVGTMTALSLTANIMSDMHGVLHGSGAFEGQTLKLEGSRPAGQPFTWTGTIIIP
jgi:hypothetical protein